MDRWDELPPLVTTSPVGTPADQIGVIGQSGTSVLFGGQGVNDDARLGGRFTLGYWRPGCTWGIEGRYTLLEQEATRFAAANPGTPIIARPFRNMTIAAQDAVQIAVPGELQGSISIDATTEFETLELVVRSAMARDCGLNVDFMFGYRCRSRIPLRLWSPFRRWPPSFRWIH